MRKCPALVFRPPRGSDHEILLPIRARKDEARQLLYRALSQHPKVIGAVAEILAEHLGLGMIVPGEDRSAKRVLWCIPFISAEFASDLRQAILAKRPTLPPENQALQRYRLPDEFIKPEPRTLATLDPGVEMCVEFHALTVDEERRCYLKPDAKERPGDEKGRPDYLSIAVRRDPQGFYHIDVRSGFAGYIKPAPLMRKPEDLLPVASISVIKQA